MTKGLRERAASTVPPYTREVLAKTAATRQLPAWAFPSRWRLAVDRRRPRRRSLVVATLALGLAAVGAFVAWAGATVVP